MEVRCDKCQARYRVDDNRIGPNGLTMRCGKCQNTFRATRPAPDTAAAAPAPPASPAPAKAPAGNATMIFAAPAAAPKPPPRAGASPAPPAPATDEAAGRTMMFPSAPVPPRGAPPPPKQAAPEQPSSGTIVFSQPAARPSAPAAGATLPGTKPPFPRPTEGDGGRSTMIFGGAPQKAPEAPAPATARAEEAKPALPPPPEEAAEDLPEDSPADAERKPGPFDKAPPRGLLIGVAAGLLLLMAIGGALVLRRKFASSPPPPAAVEMLASAQSEAALDTLGSFAAAETKARDALDVAGPRSRFAEATAALARIGIQWADALNDEATRIADVNADDPRVAQLQGEARARLKAAFELLSPAVKADKDAPELQLALADYYRAQRTPSSMNRYLKRFKDDPRAALIQGMALLEEDEGAERAIPRLKAAAAAEPRSARVHYRLALAYALSRDEARARAEIEETLRLSPQHERAQALRSRLGKPGAAEKK